MNSIKRLLASVTAVVAVMASAVSCDSGKTSEDSIEEETQHATEPATKNPADIRGQHIVWLADFDLNPEEGENRSTALALFEDVYGAKIDFVLTQPEEKYEKLDSMVISGDEVDMFPYEPGAVPDGVSMERFEALDPYYEMLGMNEGIWNDMNNIIDKLAYKGSHYVVPYDVSDPSVLIYSRNIINEQELGDDPYKLYLDGKWDWDAFISIMENYVSKAPEGKKRYGICGDIGSSLLSSTGQTVVGFDGSSLVNNISDPSIEKAGQLMEEIASKKLYDSDWKDGFPGDKTSLFYSGGSWSLSVSNGNNPNSDLMVVPFPKPSGMDSYSIPCILNARMLVKNSAKGAAVATYIKCERVAASREDYKSAAKELALTEKKISDEKTNFITEEQYDALESYKEVFKSKPVIDIAYGMGERMYGNGDYSYETRGVMDNLTTAVLEGKIGTWSELRDAWSDVIDSEVSRFN